MSDEPYSDEGLRDFLSLFDGYPRERVVEYLRAHDNARLTPTLAYEYPLLADEHDVRGWSCDRCGTTYEWDAVEWNVEGGNPPISPECASTTELSTLAQSNLRRR